MAGIPWFIEVLGGFLTCFTLVLCSQGGYFRPILPELWALSRGNAHSCQKGVKRVKYTFRHEKIVFDKSAFLVQQCFLCRVSLLF